MPRNADMVFGCHTNTADRRLLESSRRHNVAPRRFVSRALTQFNLGTSMSRGFSHGL